MLQFNQVHKKYHHEEILHINKLTLPKGIYWLQGINGSGKTTVLSIIAGLIPFEGDIIMDEISLKKKPLAYRRLVHFAEAEPLYPDFLTGNELIRFYQDIRKAAKVQIEMLTDLFKMHHFLSTPVATYSSGMVKKLSLLLTFIGRPALILLDEPLATLDENAQHILPDLIEAYHKEFKTSFIFSSHQLFKTNANNIETIMVSDQTLQITP